MASSQSWALLESLRAGYLGSAPGTALADYWQSDEHLAAYDETFAERIGWKWRAVLNELKESGYAPPAGYTLYDFGTGTGIAARRFFEFFAPEQAAAARLLDRSARAVQFAMARLQGLAPRLPVQRWDAGQKLTSPLSVLTISHVLTELTDAARQQLTALAQTAHTVIWVEPGTFAASRALLEVREALCATGAFKILAPCPHQQRCGLLTPDNERHWCHMFARPPAEVSQSAFWAEFSKRLGIDLRSLPVSYLVATREPAATPVLADSEARILGRTREYKGYLKILACDDSGVREAAVQKRSAKERFKELARGPFTAHLPKTEAR